MTKAAGTPAVASDPLIPDRLTPTEGWRVWYVRDGELAAIHRPGDADLRWPAGRPAVARCLDHPVHQAPEPKCACGLYAVADPTEALEIVVEPMGLAAPRDVVLGRVALWGRIQEHAKGWRAELAYPRVLYVHPSDPETAALLAQRYGIPVLDRSPYDPPLRRRLVRWYGGVAAATAVWAGLVALASAQLFVAVLAMAAVMAVTFFGAALAFRAAARVRTLGAPERQLWTYAIGTVGALIIGSMAVLAISGLVF